MWGPEVGSGIWSPEKRLGGTAKKEKETLQMSSIYLLLYVFFFFFSKNNNNGYWSFLHKKIQKKLSQTHSATHIPDYRYTKR